MTPTLDAPSRASSSTHPSTTPSTTADKGKAPLVDAVGDELYYRIYRNEEDDLEGMMRLVEQELSEPCVCRVVLKYGISAANGTKI